MRRFTLLTLLSCGFLLGSIGCSGSKSEYKTTDKLTKAPASHNHDHAHNEKGPHGGGLVELGKEEYHAEVVVDHDAHALRVYVLGKDAKTAVPTAAKELTLTPNGKTAWTLKAAPQKTDGEGKASVFELADGEVVHAILDQKFIHGKLQISIGEKSFTGEVDYHVEDEHHDHDDHKGEADKSAKEPAKTDEKKADAPEGDKPKESEAK